jgi:hypothetical protein
MQSNKKFKGELRSCHYDEPQTASVFTAILIPNALIGTKQSPIARGACFAIARNDIAETTQKSI